MDEATYEHAGDSATGSHADRDFVELVAELAHVFANEGEAEVLLRAAGFPLDRAPRFTTSLVYWTRVVSAAEHGILDGVMPVIEAADALYPHNRVFNRYRGALRCAEGSRKTYKLTLETDHMTMSELGELLTRIQQVAEDKSISLVGIEEGSIVLVLKMSDEAAARLSRLIELGELSEQIGYDATNFVSKEHLDKVLDMLEIYLEPRRRKYLAEHLECSLDKSLEEHLEEGLEDLEKFLGNLEKVLGGALKISLGLQEVPEEHREKYWETCWKTYRKTCRKAHLKEYLEHYLEGSLEKYLEGSLEKYLEKCLERSEEEYLENYLEEHLEALEEHLEALLAEATETIKATKKYREALEKALEKYREKYRKTLEIPWALETRLREVLWRKCREADDTDNKTAALGVLGKTDHLSPNRHE